MYGCFTPELVFGFTEPEDKDSEYMISIEWLQKNFGEINVYYNDVVKLNACGVIYGFAIPMSMAIDIDRKLMTDEKIESNYPSEFESLKLLRRTLQRDDEDDESNFADFDYYLGIFAPDASTKCLKIYIPETKSAERNTSEEEHAIVNL